MLSLSSINFDVVKKRSLVADFIFILLLLSFLYIILHYAQQATSNINYEANINLSIGSLIKYSLFSLSRALIAFGFSFVFTIVYGYFMYKNKTAEKLLLPILDILQSIPVLGFLPAVVLALIALFPNNNTGLELASIIMIFTGQVWNMVFGFYGTLNSIPQEFNEVASVYKLNWWQKFKWIEFPTTISSLIWNSMMSMAGGWFFLMVCEEFSLGNKNFRLEGLGSYMSVAANQGNYTAMIYGILAMIIIIVMLDQFVWQPLVAWSEKFKIEYSMTSKPKESWFLNLLIDSNILEFVRNLYKKTSMWFEEKFKYLKTNTKIKKDKKIKKNLAANFFANLILIAIVIFIIYTSYKIIFMIKNLPSTTWYTIFKSDSYTLIRVLITILIGSLWTIPLGIYLGLSPKLSKILQPIIQITASFPAPMLFPALIGIFYILKINLSYGSIILMLMGTQWYILFNVIAGALNIPSEMIEMGKIFKLSLLERFSSIYFKAIFPYLVTGWITAAGGAWNASIVAEYVTFKNQTLTTTGIGALISQAANSGQIPLLAASVLTMALTVVFFNKLVWKNLYKISQNYKVR
ncbi:ABC transporter permease subunit [Desulfurella sp.]|uniref:ABC transporter permease n=1 Tax=Desulfurella sp. TaxID=1962857 RepID=UPI0025BBAEC7|nr:ABC transporter permease subunit [Desulfurella sp.]